nr:dienelactone hydrolase [Duganella radicis]
MTAPALVLADTGYTTIPAHDEVGTITLFYPSSSPARQMRRGEFVMQLAEQGRPERGNGRLVIISHGSGGSPWVHTDLARALVAAGFVVAMPAHRGDNYRDDAHPGPDSWTLRPAEVSTAIDEVGRDPRFAPLLDLSKVGMYGMSAGGHTALSMAGGRWSPARFKQHCEAHLEEDFQSCVGLATRLTGGMLDGLKKWLALIIIRHRFSDERDREHHDRRIAAVVAAVPAAADFDMDSLKTPPMPLALITAGQDRWLLPRFHSERVLAACPSCIRLAGLPTAGHGAMLSPLPPGLTGLVGDMLNDPPGFDRSRLAVIDQAIAAFFTRHLETGSDSR